MISWERSDSVIAQRISRHELKGLFSKRMNIGKEEHAFLEKDGKIIDEFENRVCKTGNIFSRSETNIIIFDISEKRLQRPLTKLWTKNRERIDMTIVLTFMITGYEAFMNHFMKNKSLVLLDDVWTGMREDFISKVVGPIVSDSSLSDITNSKTFQKEIEISAFREMSPLLSDMGIILKGITLTPVFSSENDDGHDMNIAFSKENDKKEAITEMGSERIRREAEMQLEREETQNDMQEALEALELKDIKSKEKLLNQIEVLKQNISPKEEHIEDTIVNLEHNIEKQRLSRDLAEKKFYKHEITENAFKKIADDSERKIIELQTKIEGLRRKPEKKSDFK